MHTKTSMVVMLIAVAGAQAQPDDLAKEMKRLEGTWKVVGVTLNGKARPAETFNDTFVVIKANKCVMAKRGEEAKGLDATFKIDSSKKPKTIDLTATSQESGIPLLGIYALEGDQLKICIPLANPLGKRPESFDAEDKELPLMTITCKKDKS